ncbi:hypothetical protein [Streptomyces sp. SID12501]|uniref:hypothetical protein n=1 Tax=Streptomyces sp. SID12501 TaxID=2706042 RepID=UPI001EF288E1|nr:hypothetical protein [Streptomyces sp. SID12501]
MDDPSWQHDGDIGELSGAARAAALDAPVAGLRSPDPVVRDERAYGTAVRWIPGLDAAERRWLGERTAGLFDDPGTQARAFASLVVARIADAGDWRQEWWEAFAGWRPGETDLPVYDPGHVFDAREDDRNARGPARVLCRPGLGADWSVGRLDAVSAAFRMGEPEPPVPPGPPTPCAHCACSTCWWTADC